MKILLNGVWDARTDPEENGLAENWASKPIVKEIKVEVPGCIQQLDELNDKYPRHNNLRNGYENTYFIEKVTEIPELKNGEHCRLHIRGVGPSCHIWINGRYASKHIYGLNEVLLDITEYVCEGENRITLALCEQYSSLITGMRFKGINWTGIYSEAFLEISGAIAFKNEYISLKNGIAKFCATVSNNADDYSGTLKVTVADKVFEAPLSVKAGESIEYECSVDVTGLPRWSYRDPQLVAVKAECVDNNRNLCSIEFKTGLREITIEGDRILTDGNPTFFAGAGSEYYSPTIVPLSDSDIIRKRYDALFQYGFNFYRCHTHVPTEEEMCIADEMGLMLDVEFGLVSNFNKTTPADKGMEMLENFVKQSRKHPSVYVYCLGNEGSQLMVDSYIERNKAKMGYKIIKENTDNQLGIIVFGMQGELPEIPNDFETPHLWSDNFLWAYDGLSDIPWGDLSRTTGGKPCIIHEYGKFGVWPSRKEEKDCNIKHGLWSDHGTQSYIWLEEAGLTDLEERLIKNSRRSANSLTKIILEDARRQPYCSGYALWTFFRKYDSNAGLCDDLGINTNGESEMFKTGVNADVALLMERGFKHRAFPCNVKQEIELSVSNFSTENISGIIKAELTCGAEIIATAEAKAEAKIGETNKVMNFIFSVPDEYSGKKLCLNARLNNAVNSWELWAFDTSAERNTVYLHMENLSLFRNIKRVFPNAQRLSSVDSVIIGCRSWRNPKLAETAALTNDILIISDTYDNVTKECIANGNKVLLLDGETLPDEWMLPPIVPELGERDTGRFFTSFRAGWDKGNLVTFVNEDKLLGNFPQEGYCDLHFYDLMQSARIMKPEIIEEEFGSKPKRIVSSVSKIPVEAQAESIVQDPNAIKEQKGIAKKTFNAREQGYLLKINDKLAVCTMKITDNPAGIALLKEMINNF